jgi:uncharacterized membrane protein
VSNLVVIVYPNENRAAEVMTTLKRLTGEYVIDLEDAVYVTKDAGGKVKLHQADNVAGAGAAWGGLWGLLIGLLFFVPVAGLAIGAAAGALAGKYSDYGIDDKFVKQLSATLTPGSSAIFVLVRRSTPDKVVPEISKYGGTVLQTSLDKETEAKLQAALAQGAAAQAGAEPAAPDTGTSSTAQ